MRIILLVLFLGLSVVGAQSTSRSNYDQFLDEKGEAIQRLLTRCYNNQEAKAARAERRFGTGNPKALKKAAHILLGYYQCLVKAQLKSSKLSAVAEEMLAQSMSDEEVSRMNSFCGDRICFPLYEDVDNCPQDCVVPLPENYDDVVKVYPNECGPNCCEGTMTATIFGDNSWELYANNHLISYDTINFVPHQAVRLSFSVSDGPVAYALVLRDWKEDSTGLEYNHTALGDGGFRALLDPQTQSGSNWKCFIANDGPDPASCCLNWEGDKNCDGRGTCVTQDFAFDEEWYRSGYDFSSWPNADEYTVEDVGWGTPAFFNALDSKCVVPLPNWKDPLHDYTSPSQCLLAPLLQWQTAPFMWTSDVIRHNTLLCRFNRPSSSSPTTINKYNNCPVCRGGSLLTSSSASSRRVRREVRSLSSTEFKRVVDAFWIMKTTSQEEGVAKYGANFRNYDYFVTKHAVAATDKRGDQGHFSAAFITFHSFFLLEFENSLLAINPSIGALPYWDSTLGTPTDLFGSFPGTGTKSQLVDGPFAKWPLVSNFHLSDYSKYFDEAQYVNFTSSRYGFLRSNNNVNRNPLVTRYGSTYSFSSEDYDRCRNLRGYWMDWYTCLELGLVRGVRTVEGEEISSHSMPHLAMGGYKGDDQTNLGDFLDIVTSPNDPIFMFHHVNLDRSKMWYMHNNYEKRNNFFGYPVHDSFDVPFLQKIEGTNLNEPVTSAWGFTARKLGLSLDAGQNMDDLLTHADALCLLGPYSAPYVYDDMVEEAQALPGSKATVKPI